MRGTSRAAAALAAAVALTVTPIAAAAPTEVTPEFEIAPRHSNWLVRGGTFTIKIVNGTCPGGPDGAESAAFHRPVPSGAVDGYLGDVWGEHTATLKCKDTSQVGTAKFTVLYTEPLHTDKPVYTPGETIRIDAPSAGCRDQAGSTGFTVSPVFLRPVPTRQIGEATAADRPGVHELTIWCNRSFVKTTFEITAARAVSTG